MILVATDGCVRKFSGMIGVQGTCHVVDGDNNVVLVRFKFLIFVFFFLFLFCCRFGESDPLLLASHVAFLGFFGIRENFVDVLNVHEGPGEAVAFADGLKPHTFCGDARGSM